MPGNHEPIDDAFDDELTPGLDRREPDAPEDDLDDDLDGDLDDEADGREHRVARRPNPLPAREEDEEELAEADILEELDLEDYHKRGGFQR